MRAFLVGKVPGRPDPFEALASVAGWIGVSLLTVVTTTLMALSTLISRWVDPDLKVNHRLAAFWGRGLMAMAPGCRVQIEGMENLPSDRPAILMANHLSYVDVPALFSLPIQFKWMADEALFRIPVFGWGMGMAGYIRIRRGDPHEGLRSLERAKRWLDRRISIFIFPEGTRSHTGVLGKFQTGGFRLAVSTGTPIVPVVLAGTRQLLPRGSWIFRWGVLVKIRLLPPIVPVGDDVKQVHPLEDQVRHQISSAYRDELERWKS